MYDNSDRAFGNAGMKARSLNSGKARLNRIEVDAFRGNALERFKFIFSQAAYVLVVHEKILAARRRNNREDSDVLPATPGDLAGPCPSARIELNWREALRPQSSRGLILD